MYRARPTSRDEEHADDGRTHLRHHPQRRAATRISSPERSKMDEPAAVAELLQPPRDAPACAG